MEPELVPTEVVSSPEVIETPAPSETPAETPVVETPTPTEEIPPTDTPPADPTPTTDLYELPDGRKVDGTTLATEFKEKFLPDYTRKSQELARLKAKNDPTPINNPDNANPIPEDWEPQSWGEVLEKAKVELRNDLIREDQQRAEQAQLVETYVNSQLDEIKKIDPSLNEGQLFSHATKYGFTDLKSAHLNMKEMQQIRMTSEQNAIKNLNKREAEPIAKKITTITDDGSIEYTNDRPASAIEALSFFKK